MLLETLRRQWFSNFFHAYCCHNTKRVHILLSQYKTRTRTTVRVQNVWAVRTTRHCKY